MSSDFLLHGKKKIPGLCGAKPPHLLRPEDREIGLRFDNILVDTGYGQEELQELLEIGDPVSYHSQTQYLLGGHFAGRSSSTKAIILSLLYLLKKISTLSFKEDLEIVFVRGRAENYSGIYAALGRLDANDGGLGERIIFVDRVAAKAKDSILPRKGPCLIKSPSHSKAWMGQLEAWAKESKLPHQILVKPASYPLLSKIPQSYKNSRRAVEVCIPIRHLGGAFEIANIKDIEACGDLLLGFLKKEQEVILCS